MRPLRLFLLNLIFFGQMASMSHHTQFLNLPRASKVLSFAIPVGRIGPCFLIYKPVGSSTEQVEPVVQDFGCATHFLEWEQCYTHDIFPKSVPMSIKENLIAASGSLLLPWDHILRII